MYQPATRASLVSQRGGRRKNQIFKLAQHDYNYIVILIMLEVKQFMLPTYADGPYIVAFYDAQKAAGYKPEFHIYEHGDHGWSIHKPGTTEAIRIEEFYWWLKSFTGSRPRATVRNARAFSRVTALMLCIRARL